MGTAHFTREERAVYALIASQDGLKAREIASRIPVLNKADVSRFLVSSALMREMCFRDSDFRWHALIRHQFPHDGMYEFSGWYGTVEEFRKESEDEWLNRLEEGCRRIGRNLNDTRGLIHSFLDCRKTMLQLFEDLLTMMGTACLNWEIIFELRINRARYIRIYTDVLVITGSGYAFSLEFKMKNRIEPEEVLQAAKYVPALELLLGPSYNVIPLLVLTAAGDLFTPAPISGTDSELWVCSGDMLFNGFNEYLGFLS